MAKRFLLFLLLAGMALAQQRVAPGTASATQLTIPAIFAEGGITGREPDDVRWSPDGAKVSFVQWNDAGDRAELWSVDVASGKEAVLVSAQKMVNLSPPPTSLGERERERRTRYSVASYYWSPDSRRILFDALGHLWLYDLHTGTAVQIVTAADPVNDPSFSPNGKLIAYVLKHNLYMRSVDGTHAAQLTRDADENILNGEVDWVYAEELDVRHNYVWSPNSKQILFLQMDETRVPTYPLTDLIPVSATVEMQKYPKPGDPNPAVRLGVVAADGGKVRWLNIPLRPDKTPAAPGFDDFYVPRFGWVRDGLVWAQVLNRTQDRMDLYLVDLNSGRARVVLSERDSYWVEVNDNFNVLASGDRFLWTSWRDGHTHIYLYSFNPADPLGAEAKLERQLTHGDFEVFSIDAVDSAGGQVYFTTNAPDPLQRQLYRVNLDGDGFTRVSGEEGTHAATFGGKARHYVDSFSAIMAPPRLSVCATDGTCREFWRSRGIDPDQLIPPKFVQFHAEDGTVLYGMLLTPPNPRGKVPVLLHPYGGPGQQAVRNIWGGGTSVSNATHLLFAEILAREGIATLTVDNRGMAGRGRAFAAFAKHDFGGMEIKDQLAALDQLLASNPELDGARVGIWGWSYGGTMTLWALTRTQAFKAGVSVSPVTNWRDYDSIYTERYLGMPNDQGEQYKRSSPISSAAQLQGSLLLVHGTGDDNVHVQNTIQMTEAFIDAGRQFELMLYPRKTHSISGPAARTDLFTRIQRHFERELLGRPSPAH